MSYEANSSNLPGNAFFFGVHSIEINPILVLFKLYVVYTATDPYPSKAMPDMFLMEYAFVLILTHPAELRMHFNTL